MKATLATYRQSPRKVRLVADAIRGKTVAEAVLLLRFLKKRAAAHLLKLLNSAVANAKEGKGASAEFLRIDSIRVDKGVTLKRSMPRARGRASRINKRTSHVTLSLHKTEK